MQALRNLESDVINTITFDLDEVTIQIVNDRILFWEGVPYSDPVIDLSITELQNILNTARMLAKD